MRKFDTKVINGLIIPDLFSKQTKSHFLGYFHYSVTILCLTWRFHTFWRSRLARCSLLTHSFAWSHLPLNLLHWCYYYNAAAVLTHNIHITAWTLHAWTWAPLFKPSLLSKVPKSTTLTVETALEALRGRWALFALKANICTLFNSRIFCFQIFECFRLGVWTVNESRGRLRLRK